MKKNHLPLTALLGALTFICGYLAFPLFGVPITLQTTAVILTGLLLPVPYACLAQILNLIFVFLFRGGFSVFVSPTFGFLIGFVLMATWISWMKKKSLLVACITGEILLYLCGLSFMYFMLHETLTLSHIFAIGCLPFIIPDLLKAALAVGIYTRLKKYTRTV